MKQGFYESCQNSIPGYKIECIVGSVCSEKDGFICKPYDYERSKEYLKLKNIKYIKPEDDSKQLKFNFFMNKFLNKVHKHKRPPVILSQNINNFGSNIHRVNKRQTDFNYSEEEFVRFKKEVNFISGGNANSINKNVGQTYIMNNIFGTKRRAGENCLKPYYCHYFLSSNILMNLNYRNQEHFRTIGNIRNNNTSNKRIGGN